MNIGENQTRSQLRFVTENFCDSEDLKLPNRHEKQNQGDNAYAVPFDVYLRRYNFTYGNKEEPRYAFCTCNEIQKVHDFEEESDLNSDGEDSELCSTEENNNYGEYSESEAEFHCETQGKKRN